MSDVAQEGRTVLFVSHNMSAILRLTEEALVIDRGKLALRAPSPQAVDFYLSQGFSMEGERRWNEDEIPPSSHPFQPLALRVMNQQTRAADTLRSVEPITIEIEYLLNEPIKGLRTGIYLFTTRSEHILTSFDTDEPDQYNAYSIRPAGHYVSRCVIPADFLNEGRFIIGMNASSFRIKRFFQDEQALVFTVDAAGAPGMHWSEPRLGPLRPRLNWTIEELS